MMVFAQAISVHGQIVCLTNTLPLHNQTCRATRVSMAKRLPGVTGAALLLQSSTRRTATLAGVCGPPAVTCPITKIGLVNGRITRPVVRRKKMRKSPRLWRWPTSRLCRTAKRIMDEPLRTVQPTLRPRTPSGILQRQRLRRKEAIRSLLKNRTGGLSATYRKTVKANDRAYDMNQRTIQAFDALAEEYTSFEASMKKVTSEHEEVDVLSATVTEATDELGRAQKDQDRLQDELDCSCEDVATAVREFSNCWAAQEAAIAKTSIAFREICKKRATHEAICVEARKAWRNTYDLKRKASEAQENELSHRERTRRFSNEHARAEGLVNDALGSLGHAVRAAVQATHSLTCGVLDRESNEIKYLREATEVIETWQQQLQDGQPVSKAPSEPGWVILIERQW